MTYAFDEGPTDSMLANKILAALADVLEPEEMGRVVSMMKDADMIDSSDIQAIEGVLNPDAGENLAQDSRRPRLALDARGERERRRLHQCLDNRIASCGLESVYRAPLSSAPFSAKEEEDFKARMFPNYARLR